jgi:hypothetical protein
LVELKNTGDKTETVRSVGNVGGMGNMSNAHILEQDGKGHHLEKKIRRTKKDKIKTYLKEGLGIKIKFICLTV